MILKKVDTVVAWIEDIVSALCLAGIVIIATMCVFGRYIFHTGFLWADEVNQALLVAVGMFGSARAIRSNGHAEFTTFISGQKSKNVRIALRAIISILTIAIVAFLFVISLQFTMGGTMKSTVLRVPRMYFYMSIPMGFALCVYEYLKVFRERVFADASDKADEKEQIADITGDSSENQ